jgi:hypothetical protein
MAYPNTESKNFFRPSASGFGGGAHLSKAQSLHVHLAFPKINERQFNKQQLPVNYLPSIENNLY